MKVVINGCFGGFSVSSAAIRWLRERGQKEALAETLHGETWPNSDKKNDSTYDAHGRDIPRDDPLLVECIEALGKSADGGFAALRVVDIPDGVEWEISEYDGSEHIAEQHRTWY